MKFRKGLGSVFRHLLRGASVGLLCAVSTPSWAEGANSTAANDSAAGGFVAFEAGRYEEANEKLSRALDLVGVPTMALYAARTNVKLGHWVKASELYLLASRLSPKSTAEITQLQAQHEATKERSLLLARVPRLTIELKGEDLETVQVTLDAEPLPSALLGANQLVDPGHHLIRATRDGQTVTGELDIGEQQQKTTSLYFARRESEAGHSQTLPSIATSTDRRYSGVDPLGLVPSLDSMDANLERIALSTAGTSATTIHERTQSSTDYSSPASRVLVHDDNATPKALGWVGVGLGGVGLLVGATSGLMAVSTRSDLVNNGQCEQSVCSSAVGADVDRYNNLRTWSTIGFVAGGLFAITGTTLLLTLPKAKNERQTRLAVGPATAAVVGQF